MHIINILIVAISLSHTLSICSMYTSKDQKASDSQFPQSPLYFGSPNPTKEQEELSLAEEIEACEPVLNAEASNEALINLLQKKDLEIAHLRTLLQAERGRSDQLQMAYEEELKKNESRRRPKLDGCIPDKPVLDQGFLQLGGKTQWIGSKNKPNWNFLDTEGQQQPTPEDPNILTHTPGFITPDTSNLSHRKTKAGEPESPYQGPMEEYSDQTI